MRPQGVPSPCPHAGSGTGQSLQHGAVAAPREAFMHSNNRTAMKLQTALHTSRRRTLRPRVRRRPECIGAAPGRTRLGIMGGIGATPSPTGIRPASSAVMAGDGSIENPSLVLKKRGASDSTSTSSSSRGDGGRWTEKQQHQHQQHTQRGRENKGKEYPPCTQSTAVGATAATPREEVNGVPVVAAAAIAGAKRDDGSSEGTASGNRDDRRADAAVVTVMQKAFLKRVVELGLRRQPTEVLSLMEDVKREGFPPFNIYMYNACITALARCGRWRQALAILDYMRHTANVVETAAAASASASEAKAVVGSGDASAVPVKSPAAPVVVRPDVFSYSAAITACGNCGEWRRALALLRVMREQGVPPNVVSYNAAAHACVGDRRNNQEARFKGGAVAEPPGAGEEGWALVLGLMEEMRTEGIAPDAFTFTTAITACGKASQWERALDLLDEMGGEQQPQEGRQRSSVAIAPDVASVNAAISACGRAGQWERALDLLDRMAPRAGGGLICSIGISHDRGRQDQRNLRSLTPGSGAEAVEASAVAAVGLRETDIGSSSEDRANAETANARRAGSAWPAADSVSFNSAMEACAIAGRWREGAALFARMREAGVRPDVCSYGAYLACLRAGGHWQRALEVLDEMAAGNETDGGGGGGGVNVRPDLGCYAVVISTLGEAGRWELALKLLRLLQKEGAAGVTAWAVEEAVSGAAGATGLDAERLAAEASEGQAAISSSPAAGPNLVCYNAALTACARAREGAAALDLLEEMEDRGIFDTASFNSAMLACRGGGQWHKATAILDRMMKGEVVRRARDGGGGVLGLGASGSLDTRLRATIPRPDAYSFASAITACGDVGKADIAFDLLRKMPIAGVEPNVVVFNAVIRAVSRGINGPASGHSQWKEDAAVEEGTLAAGGDVGHATETEARNRGIEGMAVSRGNSWLRAYDLLVEMRELGLTPEVKSYNTVLAVCQRAEAWEGALEVLEEMKRGRAKQPVGSSPDRNTAATTDVTSWMKQSTPPPNLVSFNTAMGACGKAGQWREALRLLEELPDVGLCPNAISYNTAAAACARAEKWDEAQEIIDRGREAGAIVAPSSSCGDDGDDVQREQGGHGDDGEGGGTRSDGHGCGRSGGRQKDMSSFYATVEAMVHRQERGAQRGGARSPGKTSSDDTGNSSSSSSSSEATGSIN